MHGRLKRNRARFLPLLLLPFLLSCGGRENRPNILLLVIDTLRADHVGSYGYERDTTPAIDRIAGNSIVFENAYTTAPWTLPAFASILTSRYPWEHGAVNDYLAVREELPTLAGLLRDRGYETAAFVSHIFASSTYGFDAGFDLFEEFRITEDYRFDQGLEPRADRVVTRVIDWLTKREKERPFFLLVHLFDPHWEYGAPEPFRNRFDPEYRGEIDGSYGSIAKYFPVDSLMNGTDLTHVTALYDGEIRFVDSWVDSLVSALRTTGEWNRTVTVITADHGEEFQEHNSMGHSFTFFDEVLRVPLLLHDPADGTGARSVTEPASSLDILPTLLTRAGIPLPEGIRGISLYETGSHRGLNRTLYASTTREGRHGQAAFRGYRKLVWDRNGTRLFNTAGDPLEKRDISAEEAEVARALRISLVEERKEAGWTISWTGDGTGGCAGIISPKGFITDLVPLSDTPVDFQTEGNNDMRFSSPSGEPGGFRFRVTPPGAQVRFHLTMNGEERTDLIRIGRAGVHPPAARFVLDPAESPPGSLDKPNSFTDKPNGFLVWKGAGAPSPSTIILTPEERSMLRSLGYL